jgi:hypothetical protein
MLYGLFRCQWLTEKMITNATYLWNTQKVSLKQSGQFQSTKVLEPRRTFAAWQLRTVKKTDLQTDSRKLVRKIKSAENETIISLITHHINKHTLWLCKAWQFDCKHARKMNGQKLFTNKQHIMFQRYSCFHLRYFSTFSINKHVNINIGLDNKIDPTKFSGNTKIRFYWS